MDFINKQRIESGLNPIEKQKCWKCGMEYYLHDHFSVTCKDCDKQ